MTALLTNPNPNKRRTTARPLPHARRRTAALARRTGRAAADHLTLLLPHLTPRDRLLVQAYYHAGMTLHQIATLHHERPSRLHRRLARIRARANDPCFLIMTTNAHRLPRSLIPLARSAFVDRLTLRQCARKHKTTLHHVRLALLTARQLLLQPAPA